MSRYCEDMIRIIKRLTRQDDYDSHHRRIGEKDIKEEDIKGQEPNDKKTRRTASTMTSSIIDHIRICAISQFFSFFFGFLRFFVFLRFSSFFFVFLRFSPTLLGQGQTTAIYWENGEFHSDPVCTDPVRNFPKEVSHATFLGLKG